MIFIEVGRNSKTEEVRETKLEKLEVNWNKESDYSDKSTKSEEQIETQTLVMRRSR